MPMIVLAIRILVDLVFKNTFSLFFQDSEHDKIASKLINEVITKLLDPNLFYSRFSFFESDKKAINIKYQVCSNLPSLISLFQHRKASHLYFQKSQINSTQEAHSSPPWSPIHQKEKSELFSVMSRRNLPHRSTRDVEWVRWQSEGN